MWQKEGGVLAGGVPRKPCPGWAECGWAKNQEASGVRLFHQVQGGGIYAEAKARGLRAVVEDVAQMSFAAAANHFLAGHAVAAVGFRADTVFPSGLPEAGPAGAGMEFRVRSEKRLSAANANVRARRFRIHIRPRERRLCTLPACHLILLRRELPFPVGLCLLQFLVHGILLRSASGNQFSGEGFY